MSPDHVDLTKLANYEDKSHQAISSYFIGPQAENISYFKDNISIILDELVATRHRYFPQDGKFISEAVQNTKVFQQCTQRVQNAVRTAAQLLGKHSLPVWSPRYQAHMATDMNIPSLLGYFMTMIYNPNNVAIEGGPLTTVAEIEVGLQLCKLFGYSIDPEDKDLPTSWGHITCDGTIANLESIWVARNLKFFPLSLREAIAKGEPLDFIAETFQVETCKGEKKVFSQLSTWELLNLKPHTVLGLTDRIYKEYGVSSTYLSNIMNKYNIQSTGKGVLEQKYAITKPIQYFLSTTRHYSWPKGSAVIGIGSDNVVGIKPDDAARVDLDDLERHLEESLSSQRAVYAVVAIIGSTEEGAVDSLSGILALRKRFQARGLSFLVHADAAWGGYFCSMLPPDYHPGDIVNMPTDVGAGEGYVPDSGLRVDTQEDLFAMRYADSITVDPHKAGYIPYPAGGLCYRDERMRFLVTWTSPYLSRGSVTSIGIYGVEGSKPGASAMSTWLSNVTLGLTPDGYGALLGEVTFTCSRLSAEWAAMTTEKDSFTTVPLNMLPSELKEGSTKQMVEAEKQRIRDQILYKTNAQIVQEDAGRPDDDKTMQLLRALGSDLNINAFSLNWRHKDGTLNNDMEEANYLMERVVERLSVDQPEDDPTTLPIVLTSTEFSDELYGDCKKKFGDRLGVKPCTLDLFVIRNVVMSPFPTDGHFLRELSDTLKGVIEEEVKVCQERNEIKEDYHNFLMQGIENVYLVHFPMFHVAKHRRQLILAVDLPVKAKQAYISLKNANPTESITLVTATKVKLDDIIAQGAQFRGSITSKESGIIMKDVMVSIKRGVKNRSLVSYYRDSSYPTRFMPFYLYGSTTEQHIDHILLRAPNIQLSADRVKLQLDKPLNSDQLAGGVICCVDVREAAMQPFPPTADLRANPSFFFTPGKKFSVTVCRDSKGLSDPGPGIVDAMDKSTNVLTKGTLTLGTSLYVDSDALNKDPYKRVEKYVKWKEEFDKIGKSMDE